MIRFIDLSGQITEGKKEFAFYSTVNGSFYMFEHCFTWESITEFREAFTEHYDLGRSDERSPKVPLTRFLALIPESFLPGSDIGAPNITEGPDIKICENGDVVPDFKHQWGHVDTRLNGESIGINSHFDSTGRGISKEFENCYIANGQNGEELIKGKTEYKGKVTVSVAELRELRSKAPPYSIVDSYQFDTGYCGISNSVEKILKIKLKDGCTLQSSQTFKLCGGGYAFVGPTTYAVDGVIVDHWQINDTEGTVNIIERK